MRELVATECATLGLALDKHAREAFQDFRRRVVARGAIVWGEHCTECTYPSCYTACAFYTPRADLHCRRFERGIESVRVEGVGDALMRIRFRKWGKLEGEGPTKVLTPGAADSNARAMALAAAIADKAPLGAELRRKAVRGLSKLGAARSRANGAPDADAFVVECFSTRTSATEFTLTILPKEKGKGLFQEKMLLGPGYTRAVVALACIAERVDLAQPFFVQIEPLEESPQADFVFGIVDFVKAAGAVIEPVKPAAVRAESKAAKPAAKAKCIVWDLDNTVWTGTLAEEGIEGLSLRPGVLETIRALDARGILHSVASKNNEAEGLAALEHFGLSEYFLYPQIGWGPKSESLRRIAQSLDIGLDTFVFIDDQPFERSEVAEALDDVTALPETALETLLALDRLDVPVTQESGRRRLMYREEMHRTLAFETTGVGDYEAFLRSCNITLELSLLKDENVARIFDLSQRTNQVNVSGARYERKVVEAMARAPSGKLPIVMRCVDRFGDYGVIGFALLDPAAGLVEDYFMSCRVQRKFVEHALYQQLIEIAARHGAKSLEIRYKRTQRNALALQLLSDLGFELHESEPGVGVLVRGLSPIVGADVVHVTGDVPARREMQAAV